MALLNTSMPFAESYSGFLNQVQHVSSSRLILLGCINVPLLIVFLNVALQFVRVISCRQCWQLRTFSDRAQQGDRPSCGIPLAPIHRFCDTVRQ